jgi:cytochrome c553
MKINLPMAALLAAVFAAAPLAAKAQERGDAEKGQLLAYTCTGCHGIPGYKNAYPHYHVPKIAAQNYEYLLIALRAYREGQRPHPTMQAQAESFSEQDIKDIATYLASFADAGK